MGIDSDALTGAASKIDIVGRGGKTLKEAWKDFPITYLGLYVSFLLNYFDPRSCLVGF